MAELPILPLKTDAILADTTHMNAEEFGAYCRLLFVMWRQGGKLREDDAEMALISGLPTARWRKIKEKVMRPMTTIGGLVSQKRLTDTWIQVQEVRRKRAEAAETRWTSKRGPKAMQMHVQVQSNSNANQTKRRIDTSLDDKHSGNAEMHLHPPEPAETAAALGKGAVEKPVIPVSTELVALLARKA